jgi:DNA-binding MurR/RpiR family transcriptional regulator
MEQEDRMSLKRIVQEHKGHLTPTDRRLLDALLAKPTEAALSSATELAMRTGVHAASLVRLAKKLGFEGYPDLRASLREDLMLGDPPSALVERRIGSVTSDGILASVVEREQAMLRGLLDHVNQEDLARGAELLASARRIAVFAEGSSVLLRDFMVERLRRAGRVVLPVDAQPRQAAAVLTTLGGGDTLLVFASRALPRMLPRILTEARRAGVRAVAVTDMVGPLLRPLPDVLLAAPRGAPGESQSMTVPMALCNALLLTLPTVDRGESLQGLARYGSLYDALDEGR